MKKLYVLTAAGLLGLSLGSPGLLAQSEHDNMPMPKGEEAASMEAVQGRATVTQVDEENRKVTLAHEPIPEWQWPSMTMGFDVAEEVDLSELREGVQVEFDAVRSEGGGQRVTGLRMLED